ncbi:TPM domain-containing protein [Albidovulum sediminicola]|uniref:TPM domain-containing protein n=1 Tax=Albidovulum sediminicola TaxID=2984331 RepID=A0ABT2YZW3_9RHOB|nr:TPM domain-containing protein [Defluviimonas sp. WL0075]MCV2864340.1 TPM domain-containing protein [Defluviimonas sp. WL0075]
MSRLIILLTLCLAFAAGPSASQTYPEYTDLFVNDLAEVLAPDTEDRLRTTLSHLKEETGVEATVLTLASREPYAPGTTLEDFATGLFNAWGIGLAERNDGILVMVLTDDREMRVELGAAYSQDFDTIAQDIVTRSFLPSFRDGDYGTGIEQGVAELDTRIARRRAAGLAPLPLPAAPFDFAALIPIAAVAAFGFALFRNRLGDWSQRWRTCPGCGRRGLRRARRTLFPATINSRGKERVETDCPNCGWHDERDRSISRLSRGRKGSGGSFGGGRSSGGGASGRW